MTFVIAEIGVNHNGSEHLARQLVDRAAQASVDAIKFQTFVAENLVSKTTEMAEYQKSNVGNKQSQFDLLKKLELSHEMHFALKERCESYNCEFMSTAFDFDSLSFLVNELKIGRLKISSGDMTNAPFLLAHATTGKDIILSTGMATIDEIKLSLSVLAFGLTNQKSATPSVDKFHAAYSSQVGQDALAEKVTMLHCSTEYPAAAENLNLNVIGLLKDNFPTKVGYSDHSQSLLTPALAVCAGASLIERHITLDNSLEGPDHLASTEPEDFKKLVGYIREAEIMLGRAEKILSPTEEKNKVVARKSLAASKAISKGQVFTADNLTLLRCSGHIEPVHYWHFIGKIAGRNYDAGEAIDR